MPKVTLTIPSVYETEGVRLLPGVNAVTEDQLARLTKNKHVMHDINAGVLIVGHKSTAAPVEAKAETVVADTDALVTLAQGDGRRKDVQDARATLEEMGINWNE
jgi:hypothetical protein